MQKSQSPEWALRIRRLLSDLKLSQSGLAGRVGVSPATVSRWVQGRQEPTAEFYVNLGNLARPPHGVYFWERAGIDSAALSDASLQNSLISVPVKLRDFKIVAARKLSRQLAGNGNAVAIPLLNITAYGDRIPPRENVAVSEVDIEEILIAPLSWCPHPENMIAIHLEGESMLPTIPPARSSLSIRRRKSATVCISGLPSSRIAIWASRSHASSASPAPICSFRPITGFFPSMSPTPPSGRSSEKFFGGFRAIPHQQTDSSISGLRSAFPNKIALNAGNLTARFSFPALKQFQLQLLGVGPLQDLVESARDLRFLSVAGGSLKLGRICCAVLA